MNRLKQACGPPALETKRQHKERKQSARQPGLPCGSVAAQGAAHRCGVREDKAEPDGVVRDVGALACAG
jgi:hypothetical protein